LRNCGEGEAHFIQALTEAAAELFLRGANKNFFLIPKTFLP
jgi:hypothetical protein